MLQHWGSIRLITNSAHTGWRKAMRTRYRRAASALHQEDGNSASIRLAALPLLKITFGKFLGDHYDGLPDEAPLMLCIRRLLYHTHITLPSQLGDCSADVLLPINRSRQGGVCTPKSREDRNRNNDVGLRETGRDFNTRASLRGFMRVRRRRYRVCRWLVARRV